MSCMVGHVKLSPLPEDMAMTVLASARSSRTLIRRAAGVVAAVAQRKMTPLTPRRRALHNFAIARDIPDSFADAISAHHGGGGDDDHGPPRPFSIDLSRAQHTEYVRELRKHMPVLCLPALGDLPDCVFVEDTVVAIGDRAVLTKPGHVARRGEVRSIGDVLRRLGMEVVDDMQQDGCEALCDGGDVLYTGRHLFVGMSGRTNEAAVRVLERAFRDRMEGVFGVPAVVQGSDVLHLKSAVTHVDEKTLLVPGGKMGDALLEAMTAESLGYEAVRVPDVLACNAVAINGCHLLAQNTPCFESRAVLERAAAERGMGISFVDTSELAKKDAALTCCSVLLT